MIDIQAILRPYNPWWPDSTRGVPELLPFRRPIFHTLLEDLRQIPQILAVTGPRRIGKSTLLTQLIAKLAEEGVSPKKLVYYSFDDPALISQRINIDDFVAILMKELVLNEPEKTTYLFLDEIQRLDRWELYLKKYYDLKYPIRVIISGSASSPIFKKSRESLLGRVKDYHLLPFSFREFALFSLQSQANLLKEIEDIYENGRAIQGIIAEAPRGPKGLVPFPQASEPLKSILDGLLKKYFLEGGFPEVWSLPTPIAKQEYLYDNQVKKVIYEDLTLAVELRKPELLKQFYISLLEMPGKEIAIKSIAAETGINSQQIEKYIPLLEMTDLVYRISKFRSGPLRVRKGMMKFYLVDLALRNCVLRIADTLLNDDAALGMYAENLVYLALRKWMGTLQVDYYKDRHGEVDFIVHTGPRLVLPVEVKYQSEIRTDDLRRVRRFMELFPKKSMRPILVTKRWDDLGVKEKELYFPLPLFLLLFD